MCGRCATVDDAVTSVQDISECHILKVILKKF